MPNNKSFTLMIVWLPVLACMGFIFYAGSLPGSDVPALFAYQDVVFHLGIYFLLGLFFLRGLHKTFHGVIPAKSVLVTLLFIIFYGITDELHQGFTPNRSVSGFDVFIDSLGGFFGSLIYSAPKPWLKLNLFRQ